MQENPDVDFSKYAKKKVIITGALETKIIPNSGDPMEQRPSTGGLESGFKCTVLKVRTINFK